MVNAEILSWSVIFLIIIVGILIIIALKLCDLLLHTIGTVPTAKSRISNTVHNEGNNPSNVEKGQEDERRDDE